MIEIKVNGNTITQYSRASVSLTYDSVGSSFNFESLYNKDNEFHRQIFRPLEYSEVTIDYNGNRILTGTQINTAFQSNSSKSTVKLQGYSKSGIVEDISIPLEVFPLQYTDLSLNDVAKKC